jgi:hypothetical protein
LLVPEYSVERDLMFGRTLAATARVVTQCAREGVMR